MVDSKNVIYTTRIHIDKIRSLDLDTILESIKNSRLKLEGKEYLIKRISLEAPLECHIDVYDLAE